MNPADIAELGLASGDIVDIVTHWPGDDHQRKAAAFGSSRTRPAWLRRAYYPETNPLVPLDSTAVGSNTPTSKSIAVALIRPGAVQSDAQGGGQDPTGADDHHKRDAEPYHPLDRRKGRGR